MPHYLSESLKRSIWERDDYRCRECGVAVAGDRGCRPQTHHITPVALGGNDEPQNLITLCYPCHATKASAGHRELFARAVPELLPEFVKWLAWDLGLNLLGCAEGMNPRRFNADGVLRDLAEWRKVLDAIAELVRDAGAAGGGRIDSRGPLYLDDRRDPNRDIAGVVRGVANGWFADHTQRFLDEMVTGRPFPLSTRE